MNKSDLIETLATQADISVKRAEQIVAEIFDTMSKTLIANDRIEIRGFGSFVVKEYGSYAGRNPKTGDIIQVRPKKLPFFKVGKELRERVLGSHA
jgi:integration host factor subunit beta